MIYLPSFKIEHKQLLISLITVGFLFTGCGGGGTGDSATASTGVENNGGGTGDSATTGGNGTTTSEPGTYTLSVVDDNIIGATVSAPECATFTENGNGSYTLKECISKPSTITAVGGYIDVNANGVQDSDEASQDAPLKLKVSQSGFTNSFMVSPLTTLATQETDLSTLAAKLGVNQADLFKDNANNRNMQRSINALLIAARAAGITKYDTFIKDVKSWIVKGYDHKLMNRVVTEVKKYG